MELLAVPRERARKIVAAGMRCKLEGEGLRISAVSECLRAASHLSSAPVSEYGMWEPAASLRLASMVRRRLTPLWPELAGDGEDTCPGALDVLKSLAELGDMVGLEGGKWLVSPPHAVWAGDGLAVLLGGGPMEVLPRAVAASAWVSGRGRLVEPAVCEGWADLWDAKDWIGAPAEGLVAWSVRLLAEAAARLTDAPNDMGETFAYLRSRWVRLAELPADEGGLLLFRERVGQGNSYFVGELARKRIRRLSAIGASDARRLRFYLDAQANRPVRVRATTASQGLVTLRLARALPEREARVLLLGWRFPSPEGEHPGVTHHVFPVETLPIVRRAFEGLKIVLDERFDVRSGD